MTPLIAFYGDDFTGSTDALECLAAAGLRAVLFADVPSPDLLSQFEDLQAIGIAGNSRALPPEEMEGVIPKALGALRRTGAPILHYKVCSMFDSSPSIGSFGCVLDIAKRTLDGGVHADCGGRAQAWPVFDVRHPVRAAQRRRRSVSD